MKTALFFVSLSFSFPVFAKQKIETRKKAAISHIDAQIEELKKGKDCIKQAKDGASFKQCRIKMRQNIKPMNQKRRGKMAGKKARPTQPISDKPNAKPTELDSE